MTSEVPNGRLDWEVARTGRRSKRMDAQSTSNERCEQSRFEGRRTWLRLNSGERPSASPARAQAPAKQPLFGDRTPAGRRTRVGFRARRQTLGHFGKATLHASAGRALATCWWNSCRSCFPFLTLHACQQVSRRAQERDDGIRRIAGHANEDGAGTFSRWRSGWSRRTGMENDVGTPRHTFRS